MPRKSFLPPHLDRESLSRLQLLNTKSSPPIGPSANPDATVPTNQRVPQTAPHTKHTRPLSPVPQPQNLAAQKKSLPQIAQHALQTLFPAPNELNQPNGRAQSPAPTETPDCHDDYRVPLFMTATEFVKPGAPYREPTHLLNLGPWRKPNPLNVTAALVWGLVRAMISLRFATTEHPMSSHDQRGLSQLARYAQSWRNYIHFGCKVPIELVELIEYRERIRNEIADYIQTEAPKCATRDELETLIRRYGINPDISRGFDYDFFLPVTKDDADRWLNDINDAILTICEYRINRETKRVSDPDCGQHLSAATLGLISLANRLNAKRLASLPLDINETDHEDRSGPAMTGRCEADKTGRSAWSGGSLPSQPTPSIPPSPEAVEGSEALSLGSAEPRNPPCASLPSETSEQGASSSSSTPSKQPSKKLRRLLRDAANRKQNQEKKSRDQLHAKKIIKQRPPTPAIKPTTPPFPRPKRAAG